MGVGLGTRDSHQLVGHRVSEDVVGGKILGCSLGSIRPNHCQDLEADGIDSSVGSQVSPTLFTSTPGTDLISRILDHEATLRPNSPAIVSQSRATRRGTGMYRFPVSVWDESIDRRSFRPFVHVLTQSAKNHKENKMERQVPTLRLEMSRSGLRTKLSSSEF